MFRRPCIHRPTGIASRNAVNAGSDVSSPTSVPLAPSRTRNTGTNVPAIVSTPTGTESSWTSR